MAKSPKLPPEWKIVRFDEIVNNITVRVDPKQTDYDIYVGLEHLDSDSLTIKKWGSPSDVIGQKLEFKKGDIIFGKRRAYQRKLAVAETDGICSAHAMVVRAKNGEIEKDFLPFFMQSDMFMERAIAISVGSLSPTINWTTLRSQEFPLPPKKEQKRIAEILWATEDAVESWIEVLKKSNQQFDLVMNGFLNGWIRDKRFGKSVKDSNIPTEWNHYMLGELGATYGGLNGKNKDDFGKGKPYIPYLNIFNNSQINPNHFDYVTIKEKENQNTVNYGDIFFTTSSETPDEVGMSSVLLDDIGEVYLNSFCFGFRLHNFTVLLPEYARFFFRGKVFRKKIDKLSQGVTRFNLSKNKLMKEEIVLPPIKEQSFIANKLTLNIQCIKRIETYIQQYKDLKKILLNGLVGGNGV